MSCIITKIFFTLLHTPQNKKNRFMSFNNEESNFEAIFIFHISEHSSSKNNHVQENYSTNLNEIDNGRQTRRIY